MSTWTNEDGLTIRYNLSRPETDRNGVAAQGVTSAEEKVFVFEITDATQLGDTDTAAAPGDVPYIPAGAIVKDAYLEVTTAFTSGGAAVLDLGFKQAAGTNIDDDGIDAAVALAALGADAVVAADGALVGTKLANDSYVMATYDTAAYTAGAAKLYIKYIEG